MIDLPVLLVLCLSALVAGCMNSLAGGGTLLTFSALLVVLAPLGPEAGVVANATSTVALLPGSVAGAWGYRREMARGRPWLLLLSGPSVVGGILGTLLVTRLNPAYFDALVPWLLLLAGLLFLGDTLLRRERPAQVAPAKPSPHARVGLVLFQFAVAVYGGYFGAGIGILMISALALMGVGHMHQLNALKTVLAALINAMSVVVFVVERKVDWNYAWPMALAAIVGGYGGARGALLLPARRVRWLVIAIAFGVAVYFFAGR